MELVRYLFLLRRWAWLLVLGAVLSGVGAYLISLQMTPIYQASTTLLINQASARNALPDYNSILSSERLARTYAQLMLKRPVLVRVIADLQLNITPELLAERILVTPVRDTQLIIVNVEDSNPVLAAQIANRLVEVFIEQNRALQSARFDDSKRSLEAELIKLQTNIDATQATLDNLQGANNSTERSRLQDVLAQYRASYTSILRSLEEVRLAEAQQTDNVSVAEEATPPMLPVRPRVLLNTVLAAMIGLILMAALVVLIEYLNDRITSSEDAVAVLQTSNLATIGHITGNEPSDMLVTLKNGNDYTAEAYQMLRVRLEIAQFEQPLQTLLITSGNPSEGKSTTAANLAVAIARSGKRVILVDTDLRRPALHRFFRHHNRFGVTTALVREKHDDLHHHMQSTRLENLLLLPSGPLPNDPTALLSSPRMAELTADLKQLADIVIFDSPPLLAVADATVLGHACDATLLVVMAGSTRGSSLRRAGELLKQAGITLAGVVLNRATRDGSGYGYYYYGESRRKHRGKNPLAAFFRPTKRRNVQGTPESAELSNGTAVVIETERSDRAEARNGKTPHS